MSIAGHRVTPFLWYDGQAEEAARFYVAVFKKGSRVTSTSPMSVTFELEGQPFIALNGGPQYRFTEAVSFQIPCADQTEVDRLWTALSDGGSEGRCGWLKDRWGVSWQVVPVRLQQLLGDPDPGRSRRAMQAMLTMKKIVIADLDRAAEGH